MTNTTGASPLTDDFEKPWPAWKLAAFDFMLRLRCLGLFHDFDQCDTVGGYYDPKWYCRRCFTDEYDEGVVTANPFERLLWRVGGYRLLGAWHSATWRFER